MVATSLGVVTEAESQSVQSGYSEETMKVKASCEIKRYRSRRGIRFHGFIKGPFTAQMIKDFAKTLSDAMERTFPRR